VTIPTCKAHHAPEQPQPSRETNVRTRATAQAHTYNMRG
jgi:hypothetical protein